MKTPDSYAKNLKQGIVTEEMLDDVLYSYNKRAKNHRDKYRMEADYYYHGDVYGNAEKSEDMMEEYYRKKSELLDCCAKKPSLVHRLAVIRYRSITEDDEEWDDVNEDEIISRGEFWDRDTHEYVRYVKTARKGYNYFLLYEFPKHSYHHPISSSQLESFNDLEIVELEELATQGADTKDLLSVQFCDKVHKLLTGR